MISKKSKQQAIEVMHYIYSNNITQIHTRGAIDRMIEIVKFPYTKNWVQFGSVYLPLSGIVKPRSLKSGKRTAYKNKQYDPIRCWLINNGYLKQSFDGYRYHYTVVKK